MHLDIVATPDEMSPTGNPLTTFWNKNMVVYQIFKDFFFPDDKVKNQVFNVSRNANVRLRKLLPDDMEVEDNEEDQVIPAIVDWSLYLCYKSQRYLIPFPSRVTDQKHSVAFMEFLRVVDATIAPPPEDLLQYKYFPPQMRTRNNHSSILEQQIVDGVQEQCFEKQAKLKKGVLKKKRKHDESCEDEKETIIVELPWPTRVLPECVETIYRYNQGPKHKDHPVLYINDNEGQIVTDNLANPNFKEYTTPPSKEQLRQDEKDRICSIYVAATGRGVKSRVLILEVGDVLRMSNEANKDRLVEYQIIDFFTNTICVNRPPWKISEWGGAGWPLWLVRKVKVKVKGKKNHEEQEDIIQVPQKSHCIVKRNPPKTLKMLERILQARTATAMTTRHRNAKTLTPLEMDAWENQNYVSRLQVECPYKLEHYRRVPIDFMYRYLDEVAYNLDPAPNSWSIRFDDSAATVEDDRTKCNICGSEVTWKIKSNKSNIFLSNSWGRLPSKKPRMPKREKTRG